jgi:hypothetical protein
MFTIALQNIRQVHSQKFEPKPILNGLELTVNDQVAPLIEEITGRSIQKLGRFELDSKDFPGLDPKYLFPLLSFDSKDTFRSKSSGLHLRLPTGANRLGSPSGIWAP